MVLVPYVSIASKNSSCSKLLLLYGRSGAAKLSPFNRFVPIITIDAKIVVFCLCNLGPDKITSVIDR